jgi:homogentisate 1,2-dioxygenase
MHHYSQGKSTKQAHKAIPEGHFEEEQGLKGFFGPVSHLIRKKPSTRWVDIEGELKPRLFDLVKISAEAVGQWRRLFYNQHMSVNFFIVKPESNKLGSAFRNADGDTIYFCHQGKGKVITDYGQLDFRAGSYIVMPKSLTHAFFVLEDVKFFIIENRSSHYEQPERGMVGKNAFYDMNAIAKPDLEGQNNWLPKSGTEYKKVLIKHADKYSTYTYDSEIFDVVGWKGDLFPFSLHVDDLMPIVSHRAHLPPSAHSTFVARDFVVCTFLPRPLEEDEDALKVPFYHQNIDYDEILFYHDGDFFSRDNLHAGMLSYHPAGFAHGPHPKAVDKVKTKKRTDEYAVMIDSRWPLNRDESMGNLEVKDYWKSWMK